MAMKVGSLPLMEAATQLRQAQAARQARRDQRLAVLAESELAGTSPRPVVVNPRASEVLTDALVGPGYAVPAAPKAIVDPWAEEATAMQIAQAVRGQQANRAAMRGAALEALPDNGLAGTAQVVEVVPTQAMRDAVAVAVPAPAQGKRVVVRDTQTGDLLLVSEDEANQGYPRYRKFKESQKAAAAPAADAPPAEAPAGDVVVDPAEVVGTEQSFDLMDHVWNNPDFGMVQDFLVQKHGWKPEDAQVAARIATYGLGTVVGVPLLGAAVNELTG